MVNENDKTTTQVAQKEKWQKPELSELDINKTESGILPGQESDLLEYS